MKWKKIPGHLTLLWYKWIYPNFKIGLNSQIWGSFHVIMHEGSKIRIGEKLHMISDPERSMTTLFSKCHFRTFKNAEIQIGDGVQLNGVCITSKIKVSIGNECQIAQNVILVDSDFHPLWPPAARLKPDTEGLDEEVVIGDRVWVGMNTVILKGAQIGDNCVVGAGSVVRGKFPRNVLIAGNPAKVIRQLDLD